MVPKCLKNIILCLFNSRANLASSKAFNLTTRVTLNAKYVERAKKVFSPMTEIILFNDKKLWQKLFDRDCMKI